MILLMTVMTTDRPVLMMASRLATRWLDRGGLELLKYQHFSFPNVLVILERMQLAIDLRSLPVACMHRIASAREDDDKTRRSQLWYIYNCGLCSWRMIIIGVRRTENSRHPPEESNQWHISGPHSQKIRGFSPGSAPVVHVQVRC